MRDVVGQVRRVNDLIGEISVATREQTQGIGAVSTAITELDGATQQNAALVEQAAAASVSLNRCAADLVAVIGTFKPGSASPAQG